MEFAKVGAEEFAVAGDDHREGHADEFDSRGFGHGHGVLLSGQDRVIEFGFFGVVSDEVGEVDGNADDLEAVVAVLRLEGLEQRNFAAAGGAPGRPEVDQAMCTLPLGKVTIFTVKVGKCERRVADGVERRRLRRCLLDCAA